MLVWAVSQLLPESLGQGSPYRKLVYWLLLSASRALLLITAKVYSVAVGLKPCDDDMIRTTMTPS